MTKKAIELDVLSHDSKQKATQLLSTSLQDLKKNYVKSSGGNEMLKSIEEHYDDYLKKYEDSLKVVVPNIEPIGQTVITTATLMNMIEKGEYLARMNFDKNLMEMIKNAVAEQQVVVAVGPSCQQVKVGDIVVVRMSDFFRIKNPNSTHAEEVGEVPLEKINGRNYLEIHERNIKYIIK